MKRYFYLDGDDRLGPFSKEELQTHNVDHDTKIWFQGLSDWTRAGDIAELEDVFETASSPPPPPPPLSSSNPYSDTHIFSKDKINYSAPPKTWLVESILVTLFCCLPFGIVGIVNASKVESRFYSGDIEGSQRASAEAKRWTLIGLFSVIALVFLSILFSVFFNAWSLF
ncbi:CD225/dispanin family protein [Marinilabiliaceae bacterium ANBcel2]|nr:CD225/dispanin family protein [Marinilabiliaceae bacterium ANBcel2]